MYQYNDYDKQMVMERVEQFRSQTQRYLAGQLSEEEFRPLRLMNGLYIQTHAPMLRIAIPYGLLSAAQLKQLAMITDKYDRSNGHFTTRQNLQLNWPKLEDVPDILADLAEVEMHAIQTSGNCIRNVTADHLAGVAPDEVDDPRVYCEIIRQWSTFHPEFSFLPRKFKIAVSGAEYDRAATQFHDVGIYLKRDEQGKRALQILVGGGMGRTPVIGKEIHPGLEEKFLLSYLEAIMRIYNEHGRRDNMYKARIKILVNALGIEEFKRQVDAEWSKIEADTSGSMHLTAERIDEVRSFFSPHSYNSEFALAEPEEEQHTNDPDFAVWRQHNTAAHKVAGYRAVYLSLKHPDAAPGDMTAEQMRQVAELSLDYSFGEIRVTHTQNLLLADVPRPRLYELWQKLTELKLATPNIGVFTDVICCPGLDYCSLANAGTIEIATKITEKFQDLDYLYDIGDLRVNMSGCMNACGHHHAGNIGILGVEKNGKEWYQIQIGGNSSNQAALGKVLGASIPKDKITTALSDILETYRNNREEGESFIDTYNRLGIAPFKAGVYGEAQQ